MKSFVIDLFGKYYYGDKGGKAGREMKDIKVK
jgi:hypothetical protein